MALGMSHLQGPTYKNDCLPRTASWCKGWGLICELHCFSLRMAVLPLHCLLQAGPARCCLSQKDKANCRVPTSAGLPLSPVCRKPCHELEFLGNSTTQGNLQTQRSLANHTERIKQLAFFFLNVNCVLFSYHKSYYYYFYLKQ